MGAFDTSLQAFVVEMWALNQIALRPGEQANDQANNVG
jgi:hypothetical protein